MARPSRNLSAPKELPGARLLAFCRPKPRLEPLTGLHWKNMLSRVTNSTEHEPLLAGVNSHTLDPTLKDRLFPSTVAYQNTSPDPRRTRWGSPERANHRGHVWMMKDTFPTAFFAPSIMTPLSGFLMAMFFAHEFQAS